MRPKKPLEQSKEVKEWLLNQNFMDFSIGMSVLSAPCDKIIEQKKNTTFDLHSQIHTHIIKPTGAGKSTIAEQIPNAKVIYGYTPASIMGTINKNGDMVQSALTEVANRVVIFDEFDKVKGVCYQAMLNFLARQQYSRTLGFKIQRPPRQEELGDFKKSGWEYNISPLMNGFGVKIRFSAITFSARLSKMMKQELMSRGICFKIEETFEEIMKDFRNDTSLKTFKLVTGKKQKTKLNYKGQVTFPDYEKRNLEIIEKMKATKFWTWVNYRSGFGTRIFEFIIKIASMFARTEGRNEITKDDYERANEYLLPIIINQRKIDLTENEHKILGMIHRSQTEGQEINITGIANTLGMEKQNVSKYIQKLKYYGFIS